MSTAASVSRRGTCWNVRGEEAGVANSADIISQCDCLVLAQNGMSVAENFQLEQSTKADMVQSKQNNLAEGGFVTSSGPWQKTAILDGSLLQKKLLVIFCLVYFIISLKAAFQSMMNGSNVGKQIISVSN
ncbi:LOW QUALITY PROTEIN: prostaglandin reductase 2 [Porphyrio hochstetteri]